MDSLLVLLLRLLDIIWIALIIRAILSWVVVAGVRNDVFMRFYEAIVGLTEIIVAPIRRVLPQTSGIDLSVLAAFFLILLLRLAIAEALT
ncbi:MAG: YggT family protein [Dehalococcoidia bacterium]|nr:YggT family protein [Dehalococcoidia bacterium]